MQASRRYGRDAHDGFNRTSLSGNQTGAQGHRPGIWARPPLRSWASFAFHPAGRQTRDPVSMAPESFQGPAQRGLVVNVWRELVVCMDPEHPRDETATNLIVAIAAVAAAAAVAASFPLLFLLFLLLLFFLFFLFGLFVLFILHSAHVTSCIIRT